MGYAIGLDIGGTHVEGVAVNERLEIVKRMKIPLPKNKTKKIVTEKLFECVESLSREKGMKAIGIGVPGLIKNSVVFRSPNLTFLDGMDFRGLFKKYKARIVADNDVNCMAFGEAVKRKARNMVVLTLGTGIGGGIVIYGRVYRGSSFAGEVGHMTIKFDGHRCTCGNTGCFEEYAGARGVRRLSSELLGKSIEPKDVYELAKSGNKKALQVWSEYGRMLGVGLANLVDALDPEVIVLGGGIARAHKFFEGSMKNEMKKRMMLPLPEIAFETENLNAFGAACMALKG